MVIRHGTTHFYTHEGYYRFFYYPETGSPPGYHTPTLWVDGKDEQTGDAGDVSRTWSVYKDMISARKPVPSPLAMDLQVQYGAKNDTGTALVEVAVTEPISFADLHLRIAVIEDGLSYLGVDYDQILRDYFPDRFGIPFTISQGDTFTHAQEFVIQIEDRGDKASWVAENCKVVAFVQDDSTRVVAQAVQSPVIGPLPEEVADLTATLAGENLVLDWSPVMVDTTGNPLAVDFYHVYRDTLPFIAPGSDPFTSTGETFYLDDSGVLGHAEANYYYAVTAVAGNKESGFSQLVGEVDKHLGAGK